MEMGFNEIAKTCLDLEGYDRNLPVEERFEEFDFRKAAGCASNGRVALYIKDNYDTAAFLKANPHFRYPGGSNGNIDPCWGKNKRYLANGGC